MDAIVWVAAILGTAGILTSAFIYLVPTRPSWNTVHTPFDFLLSVAVVGSTAAPLLSWVSLSIATLHFYATLFVTAHYREISTLVSDSAAALWLANQGIRLLRASVVRLFLKSVQLVRFSIRRSCALFWRPDSASSPQVVCAGSTDNTFLSAAQSSLGFYSHSISSSSRLFRSIWP